MSFDRQGDRNADGLGGSNPSKDRHALRSIHLRGVPAHIRPDSGPEFVAMVVQHCNTGLRASVPGPLLNGEIFSIWKEAKVVIVRAAQLAGIATPPARRRRG